MQRLKALRYALVFLLPLQLLLSMHWGSLSGMPNLMAWWPLLFFFVFLPLIFARQPIGHALLWSLLACAVFVPVMLTAPPAAPPEPSRVHSSDSGVIEIELANGRRMRLSGPVDVQVLERVIGVLEGR